MKKNLLFFTGTLLLTISILFSWQLSAAPKSASPVSASQQPGTIPQTQKPAPPPPSCNSPMAAIPAAAQDQAPVITINALASGGSGQIQYPEASAASCASPCQNLVSLNTVLVLVAHAKNPGGVQSLGLTVKPPAGPSFGVERTAAPNANNCVYPTLSILGHNGSGGIGGTPLLLHMNKPGAQATVVARATNFNGQSSFYAVTYYVKAASQQSPQPPLSALQGCLSLSYHFTWGSTGQLAGQDLPVKIRWTGKFKGTPVANSHARTSFNLTETYKVSYPYSPTWTGVNEAIPNLMPGRWSVSGQYLSGLGGLKHYSTPITCVTSVPAGPRCGTAGFNHDEQKCVRK